MSGLASLVSNHLLKLKMPSWEKKIRVVGDSVFFAITLTAGSVSKAKSSTSAPNQDLDSIDADALLQWPAHSILSDYSHQQHADVIGSVFIPLSSISTNINNNSSSNMANNKAATRTFRKSSSRQTM